ncbi:type II toxin-antitoxin system VapC family toxin [Mucilaginibacter sp. OK098]|uniref:type II toxin-antitoxin system VapC family toxin n=1 Tax=Mucilaginibacter sp. OK098 TaxID=1855297 RepID=UPI00091D9022|nr:type II toxin-antitoxin system VapC family toxin [Mucilaginibacter sp. OK098]SHN35738.1 PIN domain nuclease, a component of toxin-antitoxin system (PIN domain) [Mucilaginibacter sp. OK098]
MDLLVDTQILIWSFDIYSPLSKLHKELLEDTANQIFVSQISLMELAIKKNINKLPDFIPEIKELTTQLLTNGFELLSLTNEQIFSYQHLPLFSEHKDPFDRFLVAIAKQEKLTIITTDIKFKLYSSLVQTI